MKIEQIDLNEYRISVDEFTSLDEIHARISDKVSDLDESTLRIESGFVFFKTHPVGNTEGSLW